MQGEQAIRIAGLTLRNGQGVFEETVSMFRVGNGSARALRALLHAVWEP